jgi:hypothetical protein
MVSPAVFQVYECMVVHNIVDMIYLHLQMKIQCSTYP